MNTIFKRRSILKAALVAPLALLIPQLVLAADAKTTGVLVDLPESDVLANALKYKADAAKAGPERTDKKSNCANCAKFNKCSPADASCKPVAKNSAKAPCELFAGKQVNAKGWCMSWTKLG